MPPHPRTILGHLRRLATPASSDASLLARWTERRDEAAFAELVARHGPMVLGVCRRVLGDEHTAEDAFQATFLVLARKASTLRRPESLPGFLFGVAQRLARKTRGPLRRRMVQTHDDVPEPADPCPHPLDALTGLELLALVDEEVARLPEMYRLPLLLCVMQGRTVEEAASMLGWSNGSLRGRLARGRERLRERLTRRGLAVSVGALELLAPAAVPEHLRADVIRNLATPAAPAVSSLAAAPALKLKAAYFALFVLIATALGTSLSLLHAPLPETPAAVPPSAPSAQAKDEPRRDRYGDPLPPGVVARLGTERLSLNGAHSLTFSPDGRLLAAHNNRDRLCIWEVATGKELLRLTLPADNGRGLGWGPLVFSPDSKAIVLGSARNDGRGNWKGSVSVREVPTGKELHCFRDLPSQAKHLVFSPDGRYLFAGGYDLPLLRWDLAGGGAPKKYGDFPRVDFLALSRDGKMLTASTYVPTDWRKRIFTRWDVATGKEMGRHTFATEGRWACSLSPDGSVFAVPDVEGKSIALLDPLTGRELRRAREADYPAFIAFSADGATMTCSSKDGIARVWETATAKLRTRFQVLSAHIDWESIALSADGKRMALSSREDNPIDVWDVVAGRKLHSFVGHRRWELRIAFRKGGKEIASVSRDGTHGSPIVRWADWSLRRWDAETGDERAVTCADPQGAVLHTVFSADGQRLATVIHDGTLRLWNVESGKVLRSWKVPISVATTTWSDDKGGKIVYKTPSPLIGEPVFSPDGKILLAPHGATIYRWETATGRELPPFEIDDIPQKVKNYLSWCLPSPDGRTLAVWGLGVQNPPIILLDMASGKVVRRLNAPLAHPPPPAFSPDGRTLAVLEVDKVTLWEVASGLSRGRLEAPRWNHALAFSPDGRFLAVGRLGQSPVKLWDLGTDQVVGRLPDDCGGLESLVFSPDGSRLAVAGYFPTVLVCDVAVLCGKKKIEEIVESTIPSSEEWEGLWAELSGGDGARAYRAIRRLGLTGARGALFVKSRLKRDKLPDEQRMARLIADLDKDEFVTREKAFAELGKLGIRAEPALRRTLKGEVSAEVRFRVKRLLEALGPSQRELPSPDLVRLRAVEALEANGSKEARQALAELAEQATDAQLTREAKASLARLRSRRVHP